VSESKEGIYLAVPCYSGQMATGTANSIIAAMTHVPDGMHLFYVPAESAFCITVNRLYAGALNARAEKNIKWFAMLHSDMWSPDPLWLVKLLDAAWQYQLDVVSATAAIKDSSGDTNCALFDATGAPRRATVAETRDWPDVATDDWVWVRYGRVLGINTGMLLMRIDRPWAEGHAFRMEDYIRRADDGKFVGGMHSEDWIMSRELRQRGVRYGAVPGIETMHQGAANWRNR
jgi:hypothetical protein